MEKTISVEDRIRRAEEIYYRRKAQGVRVSSNTVNSNNRSNISLFRKMIIKITICVVIYFIFYMLKNSGYFFSEEVINKTKSFLSYDINFQSAYTQIVQYFNKTNESVENNEQENQNNEQTSEDILKQQEISENMGIGGGGVEEKQSIEDLAMQPIQKSQMEIDAEYIKENYNLILPTSGIITSRFGAREATQIVSANHEGIDIGASKGTPIYASIGGNVVDVSNGGDYGKSIKIQSGEVTILYAHCNQIIAKVGESITQGQKIAEVGSTGRATGNHLHFEIRREERVIDPEMILQF